VIPDWGLGSAMGLTDSNGPKRLCLKKNSLTSRWKISERGSMLCSQFPAIFTIFCKKIGLSIKNQCYDQIFAKTISSLSKKTDIFAKFFGENIF
jgi:hypothetical protein